MTEVGISTTGAAARTGSVDLAVAGALHDFNNALQAMGAVLRQLQRKIARGETADVLDLIKGAEGQLVRMSSLGAALSRAPSAAQVAHQGDGRLAVAPFIRAMAAQVAALLGSDIRLELQVDADAGHLACDPARFESAICNLVVNARDAMPEGGVLRLGGCMTELRADPAMDGAPPRAGLFAQITVADTGCGMSPATFRRCLEPYVTTKASLGGTGLGLFQVRSFAEEAGGSVRLTSREGQGTEVTILLPCCDP